MSFIMSDYKSDESEGHRMTEYALTRVSGSVNEYDVVLKGTEIGRITIEGPEMFSYRSNDRAVWGSCNIIRDAVRALKANFLEGSR